MSIPKMSTDLVIFFYYFSLLLSLILKMCEITLKINDQPKVPICFSNISACKYHLKMVQCSKRTFGCQDSKDTVPNNGIFLFFGKIKQKPWCNILKCLKKITPWYLPDFFQKSEASMVGVCVIWDLTSKSPFWALKHFWGIFGGCNIWKTFGQSLIFNVNFVIL